MSVQAVARRYASALADVVLARNEAREVQAELKIWDEMLQSNPNLGEVFANPTVALDQKRAVLNRLIKLAQPRPTTAPWPSRERAQRGLPRRERTRASHGKCCRTFRSGRADPVVRSVRRRSGTAPGICRSGHPSSVPPAQTEMFGRAGW